MLIIKNGTVLDPLNHINTVTDVAVDGGNIVKVGPCKTAPKDNVIDAKGCCVLPGLIDHHCHLAPFAKIGLASEAVCFASGVTTAVDAGSTGCNNFPERRNFKTMTRLGIYNYINVCSTGLDSLPAQMEDVDPAHFDEAGIKACFAQYKDELVGLKLRTSKAIVKERGYEPLKKMVEMADRLNLSVMVHCTDPPAGLDELLDVLRPGDVITHIYMNKGPNLIGEDGKVIKAAWRAKERGVLFEAADARAHFGMPVAQAAIAQGFLPDILATDITKLSMHLRPTAFNLAMQLAKYETLGIPFEKLVELCTVNPARQMGILDKAGSLTVGHPADVAVLRPVEMENVFGDRPNGDPDQHLLTGHKVYQPVLTLKKGEMVYRDVTF